MSHLLSGLTHALKRLSHRPTLVFIVSAASVLFQQKISKSHTKCLQAGVINPQVFKGCEMTRVYLQLN